VTVVAARELFAALLPVRERVLGRPQTPAPPPPPPPPPRRRLSPGHPNHAERLGHWTGRRVTRRQPVTRPAALLPLFREAGPWALSTRIP